MGVPLSRAGMRSCQGDLTLVRYILDQVKNSKKSLLY